MEEAKSSDVVSGMAWKFGERILAQGVSFVVSVILARILLPDDYGAIEIIYIFLNIADVLLTSGLGVALIQKKEISEIEQSSVFYCNFLLGVVLYIVLFFISPIIANAYKLPVMVPAIRVYALRLPISAFQSIQSAIVSRQMQFKKFFFSTLIGTIISAVIGIAMAQRGFGVWALVFQSLGNSVMDTLVLFITVRWIPRCMFSWKKAKPLVKYGWKIMANNVIEVGTTYLGSFLIGLKYTSSDLAFYSKGISLPRTARQSAFSTLDSVLFSAMSKSGDDKERLKEMISKSIRTGCFLVFPLAFGVAGVSNDLVNVVFTDKWMPMVTFIIFSCVETLFSLPCTIILEGVKASGDSGSFLKIGVITKVIIILSTCVGIFFGTIGVGVSLIVSSFIGFLVIFCFARSVTGYGFHSLIIDVRKCSLTSLVMLICVYFVSIIQMDSIMRLLLEVIVGVGIYTGIALISRDETARDIFIIFKSYKTRIINKKEKG